MIQERQRKVYYSPTGRKHYFTKKAACWAEARSRVEKKYPSEHYERDTGAGWSWREDERLCKLVSRIFKRIYRASQPHNTKQTEE
jgi:hypothetical protein